MPAAIIVSRLIINRTKDTDRKAIYLNESYIYGYAGIRHAGTAKAL